MVPGRAEFIISKKHNIVVQNQSQKREGLAQGWTLFNHHYMSSRDTNTLNKGNGDVIKNKFGFGIQTIAGTGFRGYAGDGGPATAAKLNEPYKVSYLIKNANIYIADSQNYRIRKVDVNLELSQPLRVEAMEYLVMAAQLLTNIRSILRFIKIGKYLCVNRNTVNS